MKWFRSVLCFFMVKEQHEIETKARKQDDLNLAQKRRGKVSFAKLFDC